MIRRTDGGPKAHAIILSSILVLTCALSVRLASAQGFSVEPTPSVRTSLPDHWGFDARRQWLSERGVTFGGVLTTEGHANVSGGIRRTTLVDGKFEGLLGIDFEKLAGWQGLTFFGNMFQTHGSGGVGRVLTGSLNTISNIEALPSTRLSELWFEQKFWNGQFGIRAGQLTTDSEFFNSQYFNVFLSSDWPTIAKQNLPSGGPAYPLSTPGVRLRFDPTPETSMLLAVFNGDPAGPGVGPAELRNRHGLNFRVKDSPLVIGEWQYRYNQAPESTALAGGIRIGAWYHFGRFDDLRFDNTGLSLADPLSTGVARQFRGNQSVYAIFDQQLYRPPGGDANSGISAFTRIGAATSDRSINDFYLEGGIVANGMVPGRPLDSMGAVFLYSHMSNRARGLDRDQMRILQQPFPLRDYELSIELMYSLTLVPGWTLQPDFQYIAHPGGNIPDPASGLANTRIKDAKVFTLRSVIRY